MAAKMIGLNPLADACRDAAGAAQMHSCRWEALPTLVVLSLALTSTTHPIDFLSPTSIFSLKKRGRASNAGSVMYNSRSCRF